MIKTAANLTTDNKRRVNCIKRLKVTASTSPFDYKTDMMTEDDVKEYYEKYLRLYAKTGKEKFLDKASVLKDILGVSGSDEDRLFQRYLNMRSASTL